MALKISTSTKKIIQELYWAEKSETMNIQQVFQKTFHVWKVFNILIETET